LDKNILDGCLMPPNGSRLSSYREGRYFAGIKSNLPNVS
jgi:hypothetical protein